MLTPVPEPADFQNEDLEKVILNLEKERTQANLDLMIRLLKDKMQNHGLLLIPVQDVQAAPEEDGNLFSMKKIQLDNLTEDPKAPEACPRLVELARGGHALAAFTSLKEFQKGEPSKYTAVLLKEFLEYALEDDRYQGIVLNPWDISVLIDRKMITSLLKLSEAQKISSGLYLIRDVPSEMRPDGLGCFITESLEPADHYSANLLSAYSKELGELKEKFGSLAAGSTILLSGRENRQDCPALLLMVAPVNEGSSLTEEKAISETYLNAMKEASQAGCESVVLPAISEDDFGVQSSSSIPSAILTLSTWCAQNPDEEIEIFLLIQDEDLFDQYLDYLEDMEKDSSQKSRRHDA